MLRMGELTSTGKRSQLALTPELERYFWLPAVHSPDMTEEEWAEEIEVMFRSSLLVRDFVSGKLSPQDFSDGLADLEYDPYYIGELWERGSSMGF